MTRHGQNTDMHGRARTHTAGVLLVLVLVFMGAGCATFEVCDPVTGGTVVKTHGTFLLSRQDEFTVRREWLDENNVLQSLVVQRNTDENADAQIRALELVKEAFASRVPVN